MADQQISLQYTTIKTPLPEFIYDGLKDYSAGANLYRPQPTELIQKIAAKYSIPVEMIFLTAGIDEAIQMFIHAYGTHAYAFTPTYVVYKDASLFGKKFTEIYSIDTNNKFTVPIKTYEDATLIFLANPNNPSGFTSKKDVLKLVELNQHAIVVIDEAYGAFDELTVDTEVIKHPNLVVFRSFSKDYGMAGNRIGYFIGHPKVIETVKNFTTWANVSYLSVGAAYIALNHEDYFQTIRSDIAKRREEFITFLQTLKYTVLPSRINAIVIRFRSEQAASSFIAHLSARNIIANQGNGNSNIGLDKSFVRMAMGTKDQMDIVQKVIKEFTK